jgi:hypothetical protein
MAFKMKDGHILITEHGHIARGDACCCCRCSPGTKPSSVDVYFENCTGIMACLEGVTINLLPSTVLPDGKCAYGNGFVDPGCICGTVRWVIVRIDSLAGVFTQYQINVQHSNLCGDGSANGQESHEVNLVDENCLTVTAGTITFGVPAGSADYTITPIP